MRRYALVSGVFFSLLALVQLTRAIMRWPVQVDGLAIPVWVSAVAFVIASTFAVWAFRSTKSAA
jgi:hypothetical protein